MLTDTLDVGGQSHELTRPGASPKMPLRAWDAADEYLIEQAQNLPANTSLVILNDQFGALAVALNQNLRGWYSDSFCAHEATRHNLEQNGFSEDFPYHTSLDSLKQADVALVKIPKSLSFLIHQLAQLQQAGVKQCLLAGMTKHVPDTLIESLNKYGAAERLPFRKKAMMVRVTLSREPAIQSPYPKTQQIHGSKIIGHANVFGRDKLDKGTELLLQNMEAITSPLSSSTDDTEKHIADLCCGTGIIGIQFAKQLMQIQGQTQAHFFDESYMAVASAKASYEANQFVREGVFHWDDAMSHQKPAIFDLVLCNPPFHEQHTVGDHIAWRLFKDAHRCLKPGGKLVIVGNRHLAYHVKLKRLFKNCQQVGANNKFVVLASEKRS